MAQQQFNNPIEFVKALWPYALTAAKKIGVDPKILIAQAALETGWGKAVAEHSDGTSSFNLFNIKADSNWNDKSVSVKTVEYEQGVAVKGQALAAP